MANEIEKMILVGAGGHAKVVIDALSKSVQYTVEGIIDPRMKPGAKMLDIPVIGGDDVLPAIYKRGIKFAFIAVGSIGDPSKRVELYKKIKEAGFRLSVVIHPSAVIADDCFIDEGVFVAGRAVINPGVKIGKNAIINTSAVIEHDCDIGDFVHISPGAVLSGGVKVGELTHIGTGSVVNQQVKIGKGCIIGSGSVIVNDIVDNSKAFGNPCRVVSVG